MNQSDNPVTVSSESLNIQWLQFNSCVSQMCPWNGLTRMKYLLTNSLHRAESFLRSQLVLQLVKKFPAFYGTRKFITVLTSPRHLSLSWANSIQSPQPLSTSWRSILILPSHLRLGLPNGLFPSGFPTKTLCAPLPSSTRMKYCNRRVS